jgi:glycosyltransferase involved in cell wall biosynthesis
MLDLLPKYLHEKCQLMLDVGIDLEDYCVLDPLIQASQNETKIQLLYVGRIVPYKGLSLLIEALSLLDIKLKSKIFLSIVGDDQGAYADHCKQLTRALNLEDCCTFYGKRRKEEVLTFYKNSNIFCFPSLAEAGGTVVLEAMSMGLPVITINRGGPAEMVDKSCGILIDAHSPNYVSRKIAEALSMLIMNRDKTIDLGKAARKKVQDNFTWQKKGQKLKEIYEEVLSE